MFFRIISILNIYGFPSFTTSPHFLCCTELIGRLTPTGLINTTCADHVTVDLCWKEQLDGDSFVFVIHLEEGLHSQNMLAFF